MAGRHERETPSTMWQLLIMIRLSTLNTDHVARKTMASRKIDAQTDVPGVKDVRCCPVRDKG